MSARLRVIAALGVLVLGTVVGAVLAGALSAYQESPFPHEDHQGLFPVCTGCHAGISEGDESGFYPEPSQCAGCHDGQEEERVTWNGPSPRVSNVVFDHVAHGADLQGAGDDPLSCESCHSDPAGSRMSVDEAEQLDTCWSCHAHERDEHFESAATEDCAVCHVPLAQSGFGRERIETLPTPEAHEGIDFLLDGHAEGVDADAGRCATCHTAERCVACHVDITLPAIARMPAAPSLMELPEWEAAYPEPASHEALRFETAHAPAAVAECSTCHTSDDCASCHLEPAPDAVANLPGRGDAVAPGVMLETTAPASHASLFFMSAHSNLAAAEASTCATCHTESYCVDCHDGASDGGYHPAGFVSQHSARAFGRAEECATCHSTGAFCRECHEETGLGSTGRLGAGYHDAEPLFLLRHGQAARQNLESCASCHRQSDCVQCHGVLGAFRVSPHSADFDAQAAWARSPRTCLACHISNPVGGG